MIKNKRDDIIFNLSHIDTNMIRSKSRDYTKKHSQSQSIKCKKIGPYILGINYSFALIKSFY